MLQRGDEFEYEIGKWRQARSVGIVLGKNDSQRFRRPIPQPKPITWRLLKHGEVIKEGDEFNASSRGRFLQSPSFEDGWVPTSNAGMKFDEKNGVNGSLMIYRRIYRRRTS